MRSIDRCPWTSKQELNDPPKHALPRGTGILQVTKQHFCTTGVSNHLARLSLHASHQILNAARLCYGRSKLNLKRQVNPCDFIALRPCSREFRIWPVQQVAPHRQQNLHGVHAEQTCAESLTASGGTSDHSSSALLGADFSNLQGAPAHRAKPNFMHAITPRAASWTRNLKRPGLSFWYHSSGMRVGNILGCVPM